MQIDIYGGVSRRQVNEATLVCDVRLSLCPSAAQQHSVNVYRVNIKS